MKSSSQASNVQTTFQVTCICGHVLRGQRQGAPQVVRCPRCGGERFILPASPLPPVHDVAAKIVPIRGSFGLKYWLLPACAICVTAAGMFLVYRHFLTSPPSPTDSPRLISPLDHLKRADDLLSEGLFQLAVKELAGKPDGLAQDQQRRWRQAAREAAILADLIAEPIEDILRHAAASPEREWLAEFARRYQAHALLFDLTLKRTAAGQYHFHYHVPAGDDPARLEFGGVELLAQLDLAAPRRVIFGARLASVRLEPPGPRWVVRFHPDSGVLLTHAKAAGLCCPAWSDDATHTLLAEQKTWTQRP